MNFLLNFFYHRILKSFWFIPTVLALLALFATSFLNWLDRYLRLEPIASLSWVFIKSPEGARSVLSTIAGSSITVLGVILSTMVVVLTLASQQYGPRLVRNFIEDRPSQVVVGCFAGCFIYSVITLKSINPADIGFQPHLSILVAVLLAVICIGLLIYFVQHLSSEIQVQAIMRRVYLDLSGSIDKLFPEKLGKGCGNDDTETSPVLENPSDRIHAENVGYIQSIEEDDILQLATDHDLILHLQGRPGDFVVHNRVIVAIESSQPIEPKVLKNLKACFLIGTFPTSTQDVRFPIGQLEEIAIRALSPGINDPHTAIECMDYLTAAIIQLSNRPWPDAYRYDDNQSLRIIAEPHPFEHLLRLAYQQIHHYGRGDVTIACRLLANLNQLLVGLDEYPDRWEAVVAFAREIYDKSQAALSADCDRAKIQSAYESMTW